MIFWINNSGCFNQRMGSGPIKHCEELELVAGIILLRHVTSYTGLSSCLLTSGRKANSQLAESGPGWAVVLENYTLRIDAKIENNVLIVCLGDKVDIYVTGLAPSTDQRSQ